MKMKTIIKLLFVFSLPFIFCRCADDGIHYEREINVPEGIYLTGSASQFSVEAINGKMNVIKEGTLVALNTWLTSSGDFYISLVGPDGQPVYYGQERFCKTTTVRCQLILWLLEPAVSE